MHLLYHAAAIVCTLIDHKLFFGRKSYCGQCALFVAGYVLAAVRTTSPPRSVISMGLSESAASCLEEGCSVDMVQDLLEELKAESKELTKRQQALLILIGNLQALNAKPEANQSEIKKLVSAATRTFSNTKGEDFPFPGEPLGYSTKPSKHNELD
mmetsp:Transcript_22010/g.42803  ORF Transcript_22010/g.42803 Transcript_22010/m.42803 type:complete len:155 (+) Transcript_22010:273-737(+)